VKKKIEQLLSVIETKKWRRNARPPQIVLDEEGMPVVILGDQDRWRRIHRSMSGRLVGAQRLQECVSLPAMLKAKRTIGATRPGDYRGRPAMEIGAQPDGISGKS
jgi:hypothetical protein